MARKWQIVKVKPFVNYYIVYKNDKICNKPNGICWIFKSWDEANSWIITEEEIDQMDDDREDMIIGFDLK